MEKLSVVRKILRAVPDKFLQITSDIEKFGDVKVMTVEEIVGRLKAHKRMKGRNESAGRELILASHNQRAKGGSFRDKSRIKCYKYNTLGSALNHDVNERRDKK